MSGWEELLDGIRAEVIEAIREGDAQDCSSADCIADAVYEIVRVRLRAALSGSSTVVARAVQPSSEPGLREVLERLATSDRKRLEYDGGPDGGDPVQWECVPLDEVRAALAASPEPGLNERLLTEAAAFMGLSEELASILAAVRMLDAPVVFSPAASPNEPKL